jgi:hypothetical protein
MQMHCAHCGGISLAFNLEERKEVENYNNSYKER